MYPLSSVYLCILRSMCICVSYVLFVSNYLTFYLCLTILRSMGIYACAGTACAQPSSWFRALHIVVCGKHHKPFPSYSRIGLLYAGKGAQQTNLCFCCIVHSLHTYMIHHHTHIRIYIYICVQTCTLLLHIEYV